MTLKEIQKLLNNKVINARIINTETFNHYIILSPPSSQYFRIQSLDSKADTYEKDDKDKFFLLSSPEEILIKVK